MLGIFAIICLISYILVSIKINLLLKGSAKEVELGADTHSYEVCQRATPLIIASQIIILIGWIGCFWPFGFIEGLEKDIFAGLAMLGIAPVVAIFFAIYITVKGNSGYMKISEDEIEYNRRKHFTVKVSDIKKISCPAIGQYSIHLKEKGAKPLSIHTNHFNSCKEVQSLMKQLREHVAIANNRNKSFAHRFSPWAVEMLLGKIYLPLTRTLLVALLFYTSWCCIDYDFFKKDYTKEYNTLGAIAEEPENAWDYYVKAATEYSQLEEELQNTISEQVEDGQLDLNEQQTRKLKEWYLNNTSALANLKKAASIDYCNAYYKKISLYDNSAKYDFSSPADTGYSYIKKLYTNLNACRLSSIAQIEWTDLFEMQLASARHFTNGKGIMDQLVGYSNLSKAVKLISLNDITNTADVEQARWLLNKNFPEGVRRLSIDGELLIICASFDSFINVKKIPVQTPLNPIFVMCGPISGAEKQARKRYANAMEQAANGIEVEDTPLSIFSFPPIQNILLFIVADSSIFKVYKLSEKANSNVSAAYIAIDLEECKLKNGAYPDASQLNDLDLTSRLPNDPHSDSKIIYRLDEDRAILYSVGSNAIDDGGYRDKEKTDSHRDDVIYWERKL